MNIIFNFFGYKLFAQLKISIFEVGRTAYTTKSFLKNLKIDVTLK